MAKKAKELDYDESIYRRPLPLRIIGGFFKWFFGILGTLLLVGVLTASIVACYGAVYIKDVVLPQSQVELESYSLGQDSVIYYTDSNGDEQVLETLYSEQDGKQIWKDLKDIPQYMQDAAVAIEDKKFYEHGGVYWKRTFGAALGLLTGSDSYGGSTITQQLIKNITKNDEVTVKRKVIEIFQALEFENNHSKSEILEYYLNIIYLGERCTGVGAAAQTYFGKDVSELDLAECACIVGITNNPSKYDPLRTSVMTVVDEDGNETELTHLEANKQRQEVILDQMLEQGMITQEEHDQAVAEELQFVDQDAEVEEDTSTHVYSWFTDAVINQVEDDLIEAGYSEEAARLLIYSGGLSIHTTLDPEVQAQVDAVYTDSSNFDYTSEKGQTLESAIVIVDNSNGAVVALAGNVGEKTQSLTYNCATMAKRQPGSAFKPLAVYAPAIESGKLLPSSAVDDCALYYDEETEKAWPKNSYNYYTGLMSATDAVRRSSNAAAVQVLKDVGLQASYNFLTEKFHFTTLVESRETSSGTIETDIDYGPLALGGLTDGVTTMEMASAYAAFARGGEYVEPYLYTSVEASDGTVLLENTGEGEQIMKESTAYYMTEMLQTVLEEGGTGTAANFSGMSLAGKTGTTSSNYDRWFCGYSPYYTAAVWSGYDSPEEITATKNPSALAWKQVMSAVHENLEDKEFDVPGETVTVSYCASSGKLVTSACKSDPRGGQTKTGTFLVGDEPTTDCDVHTLVKVDLTSPISGVSGMYKLAGSNCRYTTTISVLDIDRDLSGFGISAYPRDYYYTLPWLTSQGYSTNSSTVTSAEPEESTSPSPSASTSPSPSSSASASPSPSASPTPSPSPTPTPTPANPVNEDPEDPENQGNW